MLPAAARFKNAKPGYSASAVAVWYAEDVQLTLMLPWCYSNTICLFLFDGSTAWQPGPPEASTIEPVYLTSPPSYEYAVYVFFNKPKR